MLSLATGCGIHSPEKVARIAQEAATDPRKIDRLITALKSEDEATWKEAYVALVDLGDMAVDPLVRAISDGHPAGGRAILVLGDMVNPEVFPFLDECRRVSAYRPFADEAFRLAEGPLYDRIEEERQVDLCDSYLRWYPSGRYRDQVTSLRRAVQAEQAWEELGRKPRDGAIEAFIQAWADTPSAEAARKEMSGRYLVEASRELGRGRHTQALTAIDSARRVDPECEADAMESAVRFAMGKASAGQRRYDDAIRQLEQAREKAPSAELVSFLATTYLDRARDNFNRNMYLPAMLDLIEAEKVEPGLTAAVAEVRRQQVYELLKLLDGENPPSGAVEALVLAGPAARSPLEAAVWRYLSVGDGTILTRSVDAVMGEKEDSDVRSWVNRVVERALSEADGEVQLFLADQARIGALLHPGDLLSPIYLKQVDAAHVQLQRYLAVVRAGHYYTARLGPLRGPLPAAPPMGEDEVSTMFQQGHDGRDAIGLPPLARVQLLDYQFTRAGNLKDLVKARPEALAGQILVLGKAPFLLGDWVRVLDTVEPGTPGPARVVLRDGTSVGITATMNARDYRILIQSGQAPPVVPDAWVSGAIGVALAMSRPLIAAMPEIERLTVAWSGPSPDGAGVDERIRLTISRHAVDNLDWSLLETRKSFGANDLRLFVNPIVR